MVSLNAQNAAKLGTVVIHGRGIDSSANLVKNMLSLIFLISWRFRVIQETLRNHIFRIYVRNAKNLAITVGHKYDSDLADAMGRLKF